MNEIIEALRRGERIEPGGIGSLPPTVAWSGSDDCAGDGYLRLLDQTLLPTEIRTRECRSASEVHAAILELCVRGAPAIGVAGAYGLCVGTRKVALERPAEFDTEMRNVAGYLKSSRPTAVNLAWAIDRAVGAACAPGAAEEKWRRMLAEAHRITTEETVACRRIGEHGASLIRDGMGVLTHCNAGALATVAYGTALAPLYVARANGTKFRAFADETRPLLQGARLTALELSAAGVDVTVLADGATAALMSTGQVGLVIVGADRIAANGDTANKIGTLGVALAAARFGIPFYVAAPFSTFDLSIVSGSAIPIEQRSADEIRRFNRGVDVVASAAKCYNPAFDVTPASLIRGFLTPKGLLEPVTAEKITDFLG